MKSKIFASFIACMFLLSCSSDDQVAAVDSQPEGLVFELATVNNLSTEKAGTLYSEEPIQHVTNVKIYAFKHESGNYKWVKTYDVSGWVSGATMKTYTIPNADKLAEGEYKFLAVGRDATDGYTVTAPTLATKFDDMMATVILPGNEYEIFSGCYEGHVYDAGARVKISMTRQVAGVMGYFKNVPETLDHRTVKYLRLYASSADRHLNLTTGEGSSPLPLIGYNVLSINLNGQAVHDGIYEGNTIPGVVKLPCSELAGTFMIPIGSVKFTLGLYDALGLPIQTWAVKAHGGSETFHIKANNLYTLGQKQVAHRTTGCDPRNPEDADFAIDLLCDEIVSLVLCPEWGDVHEMTINCEDCRDRKSVV